MTNDIEKIECPACHKMFQRLRDHVTKTHKMSWEDFIKTYGDQPKCTKAISEYRRKLFTQTMFGTEEAMARHKATTSRESKKRWNNPEYKKFMKNAMSVWSNKFWHEEEFEESRKRMIEKDRLHAIKQWENPEFVNIIRDSRTKSQYGTWTNFTYSDGRTKRLRSYLEFYVATKLSKITEKFEYESISLKYVSPIDNEEHNYIPDFSITGTNILIEVKEARKHNDPVVQAKLAGAEKAGYKIFLVDFDTDLNFLRDYLEQDIVCSVQKYIELNDAACQIKHEIDMEIINDLYVKATSPGVTWNITAPTGVSLVDHYAGFPNILIEAGNKMYYNTKMAMPNFYIVGEFASNVLESLPQFKSNGAIDPKGPLKLAAQ